MSKLLPKQATVMVMVMASGFHYLNDRRFFSRVDLKELINEGYETCVDILREWPMGDKENELLAKSTLAVAKWQQIFDGRLTLNATSFAYLISRLLADLQTKAKGRELKSLRRLDYIVKTLEDFTDVEGRNFLAYEQSDVLLDELYEIIAWRY